METLEFVFGLKTDTVLGTVVAGIITPALLFLFSLIKTRKDSRPLIKSVENTFNHRIPLYQVCLFILFLITTQYFILKSTGKSRIEIPTNVEHVQNSLGNYTAELVQLKILDSLKSIPVGAHTYEVLHKLISDGENLNNWSAFMDIRDSLDSPNGHDLKWYDSNKHAVELLDEKYKYQLLSNKMVELKNKNVYRLGENGKMYFHIYDEIKAHSSILADIHNKRILDSISRLKLIAN